MRAHPAAASFAAGLEAQQQMVASLSRTARLVISHAERAHEHAERAYEHTHAHAHTQTSELS